MITQTEEVALKTLKKIVKDKPFLNIYKQGSITEVHFDASKEGFGAVLLQKSDQDYALHPIFYMSKKTSDAERKDCSYELEVLAIIEALRKFRIYLHGS